MRDTDAALVEYLKTRPAITVLTGPARIVADIDLPKEYKPEDGPLLIFDIRAGGQDYSSLVLSPSYQFRSYASTFKEARQLDRALYDNLNDISYCNIKRARLEVLGRPLREPATRWPFVLSFYRISFNN